ncbi:hypothetical protein [Actinomycetospora callitridis]|uniref:hypothetical protein n=1 Tax=Actinomycetospora callitridis TaxID=913944 RepID=UPI002366C9A1|nr:hypothetical protein [Actinomycetospora callitridis]MDD7920987.1 hypothetical protein [Actinomycetospora callitridis]
MTRNTAGRPATRPIVRRARTDSFEIISNPVTHPAARLAGLTIRLRAELTVVVLVFAVLAVAYSWLPPAGASAVIALSVALVLAVPALRRFVARRGAAVMTRHRMRQVLVERRCLNFSRHAPLFLWSHPTEVGESVWLLLRAGISPSDIEGETEWIASGCFARDARVTPTRRMTALVKVEVIRRDPLAKDLIASELDDWTATTGQAPARGTVIVPPTPANRHWSGTGNRAGASVPTPRATLDEHDDVPVVIDHPNSSDAHAGEDERAAVPDRGGDWSDYV